jgi:hypothetical protein
MPGYYIYPEKQTNRSREVLHPPEKKNKREKEQNKTRTYHGLNCRKKRQ